MEQVRAEIEEEKKQEEIWCPYCNHQQDDETKYNCVTYWGDDGDYNKVGCESCGKWFYVKENVRRTFKSIKEEDVKENEELV